MSKSLEQRLVSHQPLGDGRAFTFELLASGQVVKMLLLDVFQVEFLAGLVFLEVDQELAQVDRFSG